MTTTDKFTTVRNHAGFGCDVIHLDGDPYRGQTVLLVGFASVEFLGTQPGDDQVGPGVRVFGDQRHHGYCTPRGSWGWVWGFSSESVQRYLDEVKGRGNY